MFLKNFIKIQNDTVNKYATLQDVVNKMTKESLHHIIITENNKAIGLLTEKDIVRIFRENIDFSKLAIDYAINNIITLHGTRLVQYALNIMVDNNIRKIIVINTKSEYLGCIEQEEIIYRFEEKLNETNLSVQQLLNSSNKAIIINQNENLKNALKIMIENGLSSLLVSNEDINNPIGIISESDIIKLAQQNINQDLAVKEFIHYPLIKISINSSVNDMVNLMKKKNIRRVVVYDENNIYHIINSQDLANNIKGNYTKFLESKLHDTRDTFDILLENIIEVVDVDNEQIVYWTNKRTKSNFNVNIDDNITSIIPKSIWNNILSKLIKDKFVEDTIEIKGRYYQLKCSYKRVLEDNIIKLFLNDITEIIKLTKKLEEENKIKEKLLYEQLKMAQMGEMISNIAHQWKQPLSAISMSSSALKLKKEMNILNNKDFIELTDYITNNADFLSNTVNIFKNFIKEKKSFKKVVLQDRIEIALNIVKITLKSKHISLINNIDYDNKIYLNTVVGELEQVVINILNNAKDVLIQRNITNPTIEISLLKFEDKIQLLLEDNAGGIKEDILPFIFDEYFTTKPENEGTGIGLYMSRKIISESLKGKLFVENNQKGAKFTIELPLEKLE